LFFDLVFVTAVTQLTRGLRTDMSGHGLLAAVLAVLMVGLVASELTWLARRAGASEATAAPAT
jgi:low temperature requirement protein LtrA